MIKKYLDLDFNNFTEDVEIKTQPAPHDLLKEWPAALGVIIQIKTSVSAWGSSFRRLGGCAG